MHTCCVRGNDNLCDVKQEVPYKEVSTAPLNSAFAISTQISVMVRQDTKGYPGYLAEHKLEAMCKKLFKPEEWQVEFSDIRLLCIVGLELIMHQFGDDFWIFEIPRKLTEVTDYHSKIHLKS
jgi:hypothetical protein